MSKHILGKVAAPAANFASSLPALDPSRKAGPKNIGQRAKTEIALLRDAAHKEGYEAGYMEGLAMGQQEGHAQGMARGRKEARDTFEAAQQIKLDEFVNALNATAQDAQDAIDRWIQSAEERLGHIALEIARRAIHTELTAGREAILEITQEALREVIAGNQIRLRVNPLDCGLLEARRNDLITALNGNSQIEIVGDRTIEFGCVIDTEAGMIDARTETYIDRIEQTLDQEAA